LPFISVVVSFHNERDTLRKCAKALLAQTYPRSRYEVILVNDGSTNDAASEVVDLIRENPEIRLLSQPDLGPAAGRNLGLTEATGDVIAFTDPDCVPDSRWLEEHGKCYLSGDADGVDGRIETDWAALVYPKVMAPVGHRFLTSNVSFRSEALKRLDGFDVRFRRKEDYDLAFRAGKMGLRIVRNENAIVFHPPKTSSAGQLIREGLRHRFDVLLWKKHGNIGYFRLLRLGPLALTHETLIGWSALLVAGILTYALILNWVFGSALALMIVIATFVGFKRYRRNASLPWTLLYLFSRMMGRVIGSVKFRAVLL
jgi:GT2 family glycosyltransferase